ncbi:c-type cytochrome [Pandoraea pnomenusa]|uniref:c-type cytochrome n=1 Tax=Pandoraea pnomenusa TaxID=93220 RepID=UPI00334240E0
MGHGISQAATPEPVPANAASSVIIDDLPQNYPADMDAATRAQVIRGRYLARLGDCVACHTGDKSKPLAGGLSLQTPFGELHSTNITPDPDTGIGRYTFEQFEKAMRKGVAADGHNLYPAMPYPSYAKMTPQDMRDLYAYLMKGVTPVRQENRPLGLGFPFNQRWGLAMWNWMFLDNTPFVKNEANSVEWNRGAYIVQGLGHCGACHTPRGVGFQEKAMSDAGSNGKFFLSGETVEHWRALSLRNLWTPQETARMLKTGRNDYGTVSGNMVDVVQHSTQYMTQEDLLAIGTYLKSLPVSDVEKPMTVARNGAVNIVPAPDIVPGTTMAVSAAHEPVGLYTTRGGLGYLQFCVDCHRADGAGVVNVFPPLAGNPALQSADASTLVHIMLTGWASPKTAAHPRVMTMPGFSRLGDGEIADILTFARTAWGRAGSPPVTSAMVAKMRKQLDVKIDNSTFVTPRLADMLAAPNASQLVLGARLNIDTRTLLPRNVGNALNCASCHLNAGTVADGSPYVGVSASFPTYIARSGRVITIEERINGCFNRSMNGKPLPLESTEMKAMVAYFDWMRAETSPEGKVEGRGIGKISQKIVPDSVNGKRIYAAQCALCHGENGEGVKNARGEWTYPPLWGDDSFNIGAGMARTYTAAAFVKRNMPIAFHGRFPLGQGGLTDQEAVDVAEYFTHQPRPDFAGKANDWPKDKKPADARY